MVAAVEVVAMVVMVEIAVVEAADMEQMVDHMAEVEADMAKVAKEEMDLYLIFIQPKLAV